VGGAKRVKPSIRKKNRQKVMSYKGEMGTAKYAFHQKKTNTLQERRNTVKQLVKVREEKNMGWSEH